MATLGPPPDRQQEIAYSGVRIIGNGSFGVVYQARLVESSDLVAIKKVLQDKRFKVRLRAGFSFPFLPSVFLSPSATCVVVFAVFVC